MKLIRKLTGKNKKVITDGLLEGFRQYLIRGEKAENTVQKYVRDVKKLMDYAAGREISRELMIGYKKHLQEGSYKISSINSFLAAANSFFKYMEWYGLDVKALAIQQELYRPESRELKVEDYKKLLDTALELGKLRIYMIIMTICSMGIRVSELMSVTVEAVAAGEVLVTNKGKSRIVLIPTRLREELLGYIAKQGIGEGLVFRTKSGRPVSRSVIWRDMKSLCEKAGVDAGKVFPHNLRHLFACVYYGKWKDLAKLADILGHSSTDTTRIYIRGSEGEYRKKLDEMGLAA